MKWWNLEGVIITVGGLVSVALVFCIIGAAIHELASLIFLGGCLLLIAIVSRISYWRDS